MNIPYYFRFKINLKCARCMLASVSWAGEGWERFVDFLPYGIAGVFSDTTGKGLPWYKRLVSTAVWKADKWEEYFIYGC